MHSFIFLIKQPYAVILKYTTVTSLLRKALGFPGGFLELIAVPESQILNLSPQSHILLLSGLMNTNSQDDSFSI